MWQKTLPGPARRRRRRRPQEVVAHWKARVPLVLAEGRPLLRAARRDQARARSPCSRSRRPGPPVALDGVMVIYADHESFTFMTPEGHVLRGMDHLLRLPRRRRRPSPRSQALDAGQRPVLSSSMLHLRRATRRTTGSGSDARRTWRRASGSTHGRRRSRSASTAAPVAVRRNIRHSAADPIGRRDDRPHPRRWLRRRRRAALTGEPRPRGADAGDRRAGVTRPTPLDAIVVGGGPERARRRDHARARRPVGAASTRPRRPPAAALRSAELTLPGFVHDACSTAHPPGLASPFFRSLDLARPRRRAGSTRTRRSPTPSTPDRAVAARALRRRRRRPGWGATGRPGAGCSGRSPATRSGSLPSLLGPVVRLAAPPARAGPVRAAGAAARRPASPGSPSASQRPGRCSPALAAHSMLPLEQAAQRRRSGWSSGMLAHAVGWPVARGRQRRGIADALVAELARARRRDRHGRAGHARSPTCRRPGRSCSTSRRASWSRSRATALPAGYRRRLERFRYGPGVFKIDWALDGPDPVARPRRPRGPGRSTSAGRWREVAAAEAAVAAGRHPEPAVRPPRPGDARRPVARPGRQAHGLGLLPRPERLGRST